MAKATDQASTLAKMFAFLDELRLAGPMNMLGAAHPYLAEAFPDLTEPQARKVLADWMRTLSDDTPEERAEKAIKAP